MRTDDTRCAVCGIARAVTIYGRATERQREKEWKRILPIPVCKPCYEELKESNKSHRKQKDMFSYNQSRYVPMLPSDRFRKLDKKPANIKRLIKRIAKQGGKNPYVVAFVKRKLEFDYGILMDRQKIRRTLE